MAQPSLLTSSFDAVMFPSPKRVRLSLKRQSPFSPSKQEQSMELSPCSKSQAHAVTADTMEQDENISPNCKILEVKSPLFVRADAIDRRRKVSVLGLPNCGNTCYLNSILQILRYTPDFLRNLHSLTASQVLMSQVFLDNGLKEEANFFFKLHTLFNTMKKQENFRYKDGEKDYSSFLRDHMQEFLTSLREISTLFEEGEQHDAHEFLLTILSSFDASSAIVKSNLDALCSSQELSKAKRRKLKSRLNFNECCTFTSPTFSLGCFEGQMRHTVKCLECEKRLERTEPFTNLQVSVADECVAEEMVDLCQCLVQTTLLSGENKYFCEECFHLTEAQLSSEMTSLPPVLVLHCNWLKQSSILSDVIQKDSSKLSIPLFLKTCDNPQIFHSTIMDEVYCLYGVVLHIGSSVENGHYVSFVKEASQTAALKRKCCLCAESCCASTEIVKSDPSNARWLLFDDENVSPLCIHDTSFFPYYKFMTITASPCIMFYYKM